VVFREMQARKPRVFGKYNHNRVRTGPARTDSHPPVFMVEA
jgi:hypothetical protein